MAAGWQHCFGRPAGLRDSPWPAAGRARRIAWRAEAGWAMLGCRRRRGADSGAGAPAPDIERHESGKGGLRNLERGAVHALRRGSGGGPAGAPSRPRLPPGGPHLPHRRRLRQGSGRRDDRAGPRILPARLLLPGRSGGGTTGTKASGTGRAASSASPIRISGSPRGTPTTSSSPPTGPSSGAGPAASTSCSCTIPIAGATPARRCGRACRRSRRRAWRAASGSLRGRPTASPLT